MGTDRNPGQQAAAIKRMNARSTALSAADNALRQVPFPALAVALCLLFAILCVAVLDDYGMGGDAIHSRRVVMWQVEYALGNSAPLLARDGLFEADRFMGVAFGLPLLLIERGLELSDSRSVFLMRHLLIHLFFLVGGLCCGLLAYRMFGSRPLALLAMLLFLLHPRLYAHSFFNFKDLPFVAMFMIALHLTHRAFDKDSLGAFALCGLAVGFAADLRLFGAMLLPAVLALRGLDCRQASGGGDRKRILATGGVFAAAALATIYALNPYYWENPLRWLDLLRLATAYPNEALNLFQGELLRSHASPPHYVPVWFAITAPPVTLLLGGIGIALACWQGIAQPSRILRNGGLRFRFLLIGCMALPVGAGIAVQANIFDGWRHLYFLWAPFSLLAATGLHWLAGKGSEVAERAGLQRAGTAASWARFLGNVKGRRAAAYGMAGAGLAVVAAAAAALHPHQQLYFNFLVDRHRPGALGHRYDLDYWQVSFLQGLEHLLESHPDTPLYVSNDGKVWNNRKMLAKPQRDRIVLVDGQRRAADFYFANDRTLLGQQRTVPTEPAIYSRRAYGSVHLAVVAPRLVWGGGLRPDADVYRAAYRAVIAAGGPVARSDFEIHWREGVLHYVKEDCTPADVQARFFLHVFPANLEDLPTHRRRHGFDNRDFSFAWRGGFFDGKCITQAPLPEYSIDHIKTGQFVSGAGQLWMAELAVGERSAQAFDRP